MWGGSRVSNFMFWPSHGPELRRQGVTWRGRRASGGPRRGGGGEGPWRQPRASRLGLGVSGSSMATRRRRATRLTPHFQIKMAQAPGLGREPLPPTSCLRAGPQKSGKTSEVREHPSWKGLGGRARAWGDFQRREGATGKPRLDPDPGVRETPTPTSCQRGLPPRRWRGGQGATSVPGWGKEGNPDYVCVGRGRRGRWVEAGYRGRAPRVREELAGMEKEELQVSVVRDFVVWAFSPPGRWPRSYPRKFRWPSSPSARRGSPRRRSRI